MLSPTPHLLWPSILPIYPQLFRNKQGFTSILPGEKRICQWKRKSYLRKNPPFNILLKYLDIHFKLSLPTILWQALHLNPPLFKPAIYILFLPSQAKTRHHPKMEPNPFSSSPKRTDNQFPLPPTFTSWDSIIHEEDSKVNFVGPHSSNPNSILFS